MNAEQLETSFTVREMVNLLRRVSNGATGDYARMGKTEIAEKIASFGADAVTDAIAASGLSAQNVVSLRKTEVEEEPEAPATTVPIDDVVSGILGLPFDKLRSRIGDLILVASKPPEIVYKDRIVERIVKQTVDGVVVAPVASDHMPGVVTERSAKQLFGLNIKGLDGKPLMVQVWDAQDAPAVDPNYIWDSEILGDVLVSMRNKRPVWCSGPRGTGKTQFWKNLAGKLGRPFVRVSFDGGLEKQDIIGGDTAKRGDVVYRRGIILNGVVRPGTIMLLDEISFSRAEHVAALHAIVEEDGSITINETGEVVVPAEGVFFAVADNTAGHGDRSGNYKDTKRMNAAFLDRFGAVVKFDYMPVPVEAKLLHKKTGIPVSVAEHLCTFFRTMRTSASTGDIDSPPSLRQLVYWAEAILGGRDIKQSFINTVVNKSDEDSHEALMQLFTAGIEIELVKRGLRGETIDPTSKPVGSNAHEVLMVMNESYNKVSAIKAYRLATNLGLKESKDAIDAAERNGGVLYSGSNADYAKQLARAMRDQRLSVEYRPASTGAGEVASNLEAGIREMAQKL